MGEPFSYVRQRCDGSYEFVVAPLTKDQAEAAKAAANKVKKEPSE